LNYKELKSLLEARARVIDDLTIKINQLKHMLAQKSLIGDTDFHHKEEKNN
jgi:hypothetical protein